MKVVLIFGPQAVGKMTVGKELEKQTGLKLFHNNMTVELLTPFFGFTPEMWELSSKFRKEIFKTMADTNQKGLIFTFVWAFDSLDDWMFVEEVCNIFESKGGTVYFVELKADINERLLRNQQAAKPSKRNLQWAEKEIRESMRIHRLNSNPGEINRENYIKINNTHLSPEEVAEMIIEKFQL